MQVLNILKERYFYKFSKREFGLYSPGNKIKYQFRAFCKTGFNMLLQIEKGEGKLYTSRNRIDFYMTKTLDIFTKIDCFKDKFGTNYFVSAGPVVSF